MTNNIPVLNLDQYQFIFTQWYKDVKHADSSSYDIYEIVSIDKTTNVETLFGLYASKSELGILRLAYYTEIFVKGKDYIASSFVHPQIISWVYENRNKLIPVAIDLGYYEYDEKTNTFNWPRHSKINKAICQPNKDLIESLYREINQYDNQFWELLSRVNTESILAQHNYFSSNYQIYSFIHDIFQIPSDDEDFSNDKNLSQTNSSDSEENVSPLKPPSLLDANPHISLADGFRKPGLNFDYHRQNFHKVEQSENPYTKFLIRFLIDTFDEKSYTKKSDILNMILQGHEHMINKMLKMVSGSVKLEGSYLNDISKEIEYCQEDKLLGDKHFIFSIELEPNDVTDAPKLTRNYIMYVLVFEYGSKYYTQPIYIRDKEAKINKYGLYDLIYTAGIFINKPFDYEHQLGITPCTSNAIFYKGKTPYLFFSDCNQTIFPMNVDEYIREVSKVII